MARRATANIDYTSRDYDAFREMLIQYLQRRIPEYTDTSETDAGIVILEALANGLDILSLYMDILANDVILETTQDRAVAILIARILGYTPYNQTTSITKQVFVLSEVMEESTLIPAGTIVTNVPPSDDILPIQFQTMEDLYIPSGALGDEQDAEGNYLYTVDVAQGETIEDDLLGTSTGAAYQRFTLSYENVLVDTLRVFVQTDNDVEEWTRIDSFLNIDLDENSTVYMVNVSEYNICEIEFGNGIRGKIPPVIEDGISADYRVGGGNASNVAANVLTSVDEVDIDAVDSTFNPEESYVKGHDMESLAEIKMNAPASFRVLDRCVTLKDYEDLFMLHNENALYGIWRVQALNDAFDALKANLYVHMREGYEYNDEVIEQMEELLQDRIIIGTSYSINDHENTDIDMTSNLIVNQDYIQSEVVEQVRALVESYFADQTLFTFDSVFINSNLEQLVLNSVDGADAWRITNPVTNVLTPDSPQSIFRLVNHRIIVSGGIVE